MLNSPPFSGFLLQSFKQTNYKGTYTDYGRISRQLTIFTAKVLIIYLARSAICCCVRKWIRSTRITGRKAEAYDCRGGPEAKRRNSIAAVAMAPQWSFYALHSMRDDTAGNFTIRTANILPVQGFLRHLDKALETGNCCNAIAIDICRSTNKPVLLLSRWRQAVWDAYTTETPKNQKPRWVASLHHLALNAQDTCNRPLWNPAETFTARARPSRVVLVTRQAGGGQHQPGTY